jgi:hypothetical protein
VRDLDSATIAPILTALADDTSAAIRAEAGISDRGLPRDGGDPAAVIADAARGVLPDDPAIFRQVLKLAEDSASEEVLLGVVARVHEREGSEPAGVRDQWRLTRAAAHVSLAQRGSRVALYDLRESLETAKGPLPVEFLAALKLIGDATCLEAIAGAHAKAKDGWWREHLAGTFRDIVARERLTKRHATLKRIEKRWPGSLGEIGAGGAGRAG